MGEVRIKGGITWKEKTHYGDIEYGEDEPVSTLVIDRKKLDEYIENEVRIRKIKERLGKIRFEQMLMKIVDEEIDKAEKKWEEWTGGRK